MRRVYDVQRMRIASESAAGVDETALPDPGNGPEIRVETAQATAGGVFLVDGVNWVY